MAFLTGRLCRAIGLCLVLVHTRDIAVAAQGTSAREVDVKAAFLFNFSKYIGWPRPASPDQPMRVCAVADPDFSRALRQVIEGETVAGRELIPMSPATPEAARSCDLLYIGRMEMSRGRSLLQAVRGWPVLTVGETPEFLEAGGTIAFARVDNKVRFDINRTAADQQGLTISSQLLRFARTVVER